MDILFQNVLEISVFTSVTIIFLGLLSHFLVKRYGVTWRYFVWLVIGIRLILPFHFTIPRPIVEIPAPQVRTEAPAETVVGSWEDDYLNEVSSQPVENVKAQNGLNQPSERGDLSIILSHVQEKLWIYWLLGMIIFFGWQGEKYRNFLLNLNRNSRSIRDAKILEVYYDACKEMNIKKRPEIFLCGILPSPLCVGFFRQKIYLNHEEYKSDQLSYILKHELVHCKRRDIWYKVLLLLAKGIHFFNPVVHWMVHLAQRDIEYSCDSLVLQKCSLSQRQDYGLTILDSIRQGGQTNPISTSFHGNKEELKVRIDHIFDMRKKKRGTLLLLTLLLLVWVGTAFVGCGKKGEMSQNPATEDWVKTLYGCKLDYIGNHVGVGDILGNLTLPEGIKTSSEGIELFTKEEPYGARQYLVLAQGAQIPQNGWFKKDSMIFLALVDNASFFEFVISDAKGEEQILHFGREDAVDYFGDTDLRSMAVDESTFRNFIYELEQLFPENADYSLNQIESSILLDEIAEEMGENFSYAALQKYTKYEELLKLGEGALSEMLIQFGQGQADDTRGYIMMAVCLELLKTPTDTISSLLEEMTPSQWYSAYCALDSVAILPFQYDESIYTEELEKIGILSMKNATKEGLVTRHSDVLKAVYTAMEQRFSEEGGNREVQIFAPLISHISQKDDKLSVYAVIGLTRYSFLRTPNVGYQLIEGGGSCVPSRLNFEWKDGGWNLVEWEEAKDGSEYATSIKEMCKGTIGVANDMISYDTREMQMLLMQNLIFYMNDKWNITVYGNSYMEEKDIQEVCKYISFIQT